MMSLLTIPVFTLEGHPKCTLPMLLARLSRSEDVVLRNLQAHQEHVVYLFLAQLVLLCTTPGEDLPATETEWRKRLLALTGGKEHPWSLYREDVSVAAFLQPPDPSGSAKYKLAATTPDAADLLATAKNHDVKRQRVVEATSELWVYALISGQTSDGYLGSGNHGVARMNGGYGSRSLMSTTTELSWGVRLNHDVAAAHAQQATQLRNFSYSETGHALLWTVPWDGTASLARTSCRPHFIEVCRRLWLRPDGMWKATTKTPRLSAKLDKGHVGDPWIPVRVKDSAALSVSGRGFDRRVVTELLRSTYLRPACATTLEEPHWLILMALARGQGGTSGFHRRYIPVPPYARKLFGRQLAGLPTPFEEQLQDHDTAANTMRNKVLYRVLKEVFVEGENRLHHLLDAFDHRVDGHFFEYLWPIAQQASDDTPQASDEEVQLEWEAYLAQAAHDALLQAASVLLPEGRSLSRSGASSGSSSPSDGVWRRTQELTGRFFFAIRKHFPTLVEAQRMPSSPRVPQSRHHGLRRFLAACMQDKGGPSKGDLAAIRRWQPRGDAMPSLQAIKWAVVCDVGTSNTDLAALQALAILHKQHKQNLGKVGKSLHQAGLSPLRLERLLSATEEQLPGLFRRIVQRLGSAGTPVDALALCRLLQHDNTDVRVKIASSYYLEEHHSSGENHV